VIQPAREQTRAYSVAARGEDTISAGQTSTSSSSEWGRALSTPTTREALLDDALSPLSRSDLTTVQGLFSRIHLPWRLFLADSLFQQITIPEVAVAVSLSKRYATNPKERMEATLAFLKTIVLDGPDSPTGEAAINKVNEVHQEMGIDPLRPAFSFVLYTLSRGLIRSLRNNSSIEPTFEEELALFRFMRRTGEKMGASNIPSNYEEFIESSERFKTECWSSRSSVPREVAQSLLDNAFSRVPGAVRPLLRGLVLSLVEPGVLKQLGIKPPSPLTRKIARSAIHYLG